MKKSIFVWLSLCLVVCLPFKASAAATCDQYPGDTWIYGGLTSTIKPNVLIIVDTSLSMDENVSGTATAYNAAITYTATESCRNSRGREVNCISNSIYRQDSGRWVDAGFNLADVTTNCNGVNPYAMLASNGQYNGRSLSSIGACSTSGTSIYATGNWINWNKGPTTEVPKIAIARDVVKNLISSTTGVNFGVMLYNNGGQSNQTNSVKQSAGSRFFTFSVSGTNYTTTIKDMDAIFSGTITNRAALLDSINSSTVVSQGWTPLAESLYEAGQYFKGGTSAYSADAPNLLPGLNSSKKYTTPITASCQKNYIILVTDGMSTSDDDLPPLNSLCPSTRLNCRGDYDGDNKEPDNQKCGDSNSTTLCHMLDDVAKYLYDEDLLPDDTSVGKEHTLGKQNVSTYTIGFGLDGANADAVELLQRAADASHGHGASYLAGNQSALTAALTNIMSGILSVDSSFVAPVVPVSPDNRTYSSNRIYMGFFKPINQSYWEGNLKKYGLDAQNNITDKNGNPAIWVDSDNDGNDDVSSTALPANASHGSFRNSSVSFWGSVADAGKVNSGGAGDQLLLRDFSTNPRKLYTYTGTNAALTDSSNAFSKTNVALSAATLNVTDAAAKDKLIDFTYGLDAYDENTNGNLTEKRSWLLGDILHANPLAVNYSTYSTSIASNESNCTVNKSIIYVGSNDGMLHAFKDCDGSEAWAFIPPEVLGNLKDINGQLHTYAVDATPSVYLYDQNKNGNIETANDKVILLFGTRRGGGLNSAPTKGSYYALDVSDPTAPRYLWSLSNASANFAELAESWGEARVVKLKVGTATKIAALIVGGYDNMNEDSRFGHTQTFSGSATVSNSVSGAGNVTSSGSLAQGSPRGRGLYAVEIATLNSAGVPSFASSGSRIWGVVKGGSTDYTSTPATHAGMDFSFAADITTLDVDGNGYVDRLYTTDVGGNLWRFDVGSTTVSDWKAYKIFSTNPVPGASTDTGRKMFYRPVATLEASATIKARGNDALIFMGSGDREHPLNTAVIDRIYAVRDKGQISAKSESDLLDVTSDQLQTATTANSGSAANPTVGSVDYYLKQLRTNFGWYIRLDQNQGEKVLAAPALLNKIAYFTTFTPGASISADPCKPSNLGTGRIYVLNYATGESVMNYDTTNDTTVTSNKRAKAEGVIKVRSDRVKTLGSGPPSTPKFLKDKLIISAGGGIPPEKIKPGGRVINLYWGQM